MSMQLEVYHSPWKKARGLMFSKKRNLVFVFEHEQRVSLHMFFVFFPIDVLFLDHKKKIVEIKTQFKPFTFYKSKEKAKYVVELVNNKKKYKKGEVFTFP